MVTSLFFFRKLFQDDLFCPTFVSLISRFPTIAADGKEAPILEVTVGMAELVLVMTTRDSRTNVQNKVLRWEVHSQRYIHFLFNPAQFISEQLFHRLAFPESEVGTPDQR